MATAPRARSRGRWAALVAISAGVVIAQTFAAATASAASPRLTITADRPGAVPTGHNWAYNDFFPRIVSVHQGAEITFAIKGFHTATLLPAAVTPHAARASMGLLTADADDTTPNPNGSTHTQVNLAATFPIPGGCGTTANPCAFNG